MVYFFVQALYGEPEDQNQDQWQIMACLRDRNYREYKEITKLAHENESMRKSIESLERIVDFIRLSDEAFIHYIQGSNLDKVSFPTHGRFSTVLCGLESNAEYQAVFNNTLKPYGFIFSCSNSSIVHDTNINTTTLQLNLMETPETMHNAVMQRTPRSRFGTDEATIDGQKMKNENEYFGQTQVSKGALTFKKKQDLTCKELIGEAEQQIIWNKWQTAYIRLAGHCFVQA